MDIYEQEKKYRNILLKKTHIKLAVDSIVSLIKGKHPADPEKTVSDKVILEALKILIDRALPCGAKAKNEVQHTHTFTDIPLEEIKLSTDKTNHGADIRNGGESKS